MGGLFLIRGDQCICSGMAVDMCSIFNGILFPASFCQYFKFMIIILIMVSSQQSIITAKVISICIH